MAIRFFSFCSILFSMITSAEVDNKDLIISNFFKNNKKEKNVKEIIEDKLQYQILKEGEGEQIQKYFFPLVKIKGNFLNGDTFLEEQEIVLSLNEINSGLFQSILGMREKEVRRIFIHPFLNKNFLSNSILIFEVEVIKSDSSKISSLQKCFFEKKIR